MSDEPIKAVLGEWVEYASYTYTPEPKTEAERVANRQLEALFGRDITKRYLDLIEKEKDDN